MRYPVIFLTLSSFLFSYESLSQSIGSEFTYECLGEGSTPDTRLYKIQFKRYEDCNAVPLASDYSAIVYSDGSFVFVDSGLFLDSTVRIENPEFPCQTLSDSVC